MAKSWSCPKSKTKSDAGTNLGKIIFHTDHERLSEVLGDTKDTVCSHSIHAHTPCVEVCFYSGSQAEDITGDPYKTGKE